MNRYDDVHLNISRLLAAQRQAGTAYNTQARSGKQPLWLHMMENYLKLAVGIFEHKTRLRQRLIYANLKLAWFYEFRNYWINELGNRRIEPPDFYHLLGVYRQKFQNLELPAAATSQEFLNTWQRPESIYLLLAYIYKLALHPLTIYTAAKYIPHNANVCEFGCGLAPVTRDLCQYYSHRNLRITAADIPTCLLHYAGWKFRDTPYVRILQINPASDHPLTNKFDVITCLTVFEHLPRPLAIARHFHHQLKHGGRLIFDYRQSEGTGLDTRQSATLRQQTLEFINQHFTVIHGHISPAQINFGLVVCQKKDPD